MADESELKTLYEGIEASEAEMARYRGRLASRLRTAPRRRAWVGGPAWAGLAAAAFAAVLLWWPSSPRVEPRTLAELELLAATDPQALLEARPGSNATLIHCLTRPDGSALLEAAAGLATEPRAEVRVFYLEYLLDHADAYRLHAERIERLMEPESDPLALELYRKLLGMARVPERTGAAA